MASKSIKKYALTILSSLDLLFTTHSGQPQSRGTIPLTNAQLLYNEFCHFQSLRLIILSSFKLNCLNSLVRSAAYCLNNLVTPAERCLNGLYRPAGLATLAEHCLNGLATPANYCLNSLARPAETLPDWPG
jgi:hypothetical protein